MVKATPELARELLDALGLPPGAAYVMRQRTGAGEYLLVRLSPSAGSLLKHRPNTFKGLRVEYEGQPRVVPYGAPV